MSSRIIFIFIIPVRRDTHRGFLFCCGHEPRWRDTNQGRGEILELYFSFLTFHKKYMNESKNENFQTPSVDKNIELIVRIKEKSEDDFEKNITYISAGTLALSLTFIEKIVNLSSAYNKFELILAWIYLAAALLFNLITHMISSYYSDKSIDDYYDRPKLLNKNIKRRNFNMRYFNFLTVIIMIIGILFLISFSSKNVFMAKEKSPQTQSQNVQNADSTKGRTLVRTESGNVSKPSTTKKEIKVTTKK